MSKSTDTFTNGLLLPTKRRASEPPNISCFQRIKKYPTSDKLNGHGTWSGLPSAGLVLQNLNLREGHIALAAWDVSPAAPGARQRPRGQEEPRKTAVVTVRQNAENNMKRYNMRIYNAWMSTVMTRFYTVIKPKL